MVHNYFVFLFCLSSIVHATCTIKSGYDVVGDNQAVYNSISQDDCCSKCSQSPSCKAAAYWGGNCYLKGSSQLTVKADTTAIISGEPSPPVPIPPTPDSQKAAKIVASMTLQEKLSLLNGIGWSGYNQVHGYYIGNTPNVSRVGVPSMNAQDGPQGFRTTDQIIIGEVTAWPCSLGVAATWDSELMYEWGKALGQEALAKGANVLLGPSVNVHRVARGGRNAEYLSGESPYLGSVMATSYVKGIQSQGVGSVVKHYSLNNQETNRNTVDSHADARTRFEVYYPPFQAAIDAGTLMVMCSYNLVNGIHACGNPDLLDGDLKTRMGFGGFVMSDWWAIKGDGYQYAGLDQDQAGTDGYFNPDKLAPTPIDRIDNMATRIISALLPLAPVCTPPSCDAQLYNTKATTEDHVALARKIGSNSVILLKNDNNVLPLKHGSVLAVVGNACDAPNDINALLAKWDLGNYYSIGGSGRVISANPVSILNGLKSSGYNFTIQTSISDDVNAAKNAMNGANLVIICAATTSTENEDRNNLLLDQDSFVDGVLSVAQIPSVVLLNTPGAVLTNWASKATAIANMFLAGQETGNAWADVLVGQVNPSGKLPVTFPVAESDTIPPCSDLYCEYTEKLVVGWKRFIGKAVQFPFGHGLSYTNFRYEWAQSPSTNCRESVVVCMSINLYNSGGVDGAEVPQLYAAFPENAGEPALQLKGFSKVFIRNGGNTVVTFELSERDLSVYVEGTSSWSRPSGEFVFSVGSSSRDIRLKGSISL